MDLTLSQLKLAELYKIQLSSGDYLYYTSHNTNLTYLGNNYIALPIKRAAINYYSNLQVDKVDINIGLVGVTVGVNNYTIPQIIDRGWLRKAYVWIYLVDWALLDSSNILFEGQITGSIGYDQGILTISVSGFLDNLNTLFPKILYTELCQHNLFSIGTFACNATKASFKVTGTVTSSTDKFTITASPFSFASFASGYWLDGEILLTSGSNIGISRSIKLHSDGYIGVRVAFPDTIVSGVTFDAYPGCDRKGVTCQTKFNNFINFFGFEYIPRPETLYGV